MMIYSVAIVLRDESWKIAVSDSHVKKKNCVIGVILLQYCEIMVILTGLTVQLKRSNNQPQIQTGRTGTALDQRQPVLPQSSPAHQTDHSSQLLLLNCLKIFLGMTL